MMKGTNGFKRPKVKLKTLNSEGFDITKTKCIETDSNL